MYKLTKIYKFEMAHILDKSYAKECQKLHGHSYKLEIHLSSDKLNSMDMVIDFKKLSEIVDPIINKLDHACMIKNNALIEKQLQNKFTLKGVIFTEFNPTAENIIKFLYKKLNEYLYDFDMELTLWETETGSISYHEK